MIEIVSWISIVETTFLFFRTIKRLMLRRINILNMTSVAFFLIQVLPFILFRILRFQDLYQYRYPVIYSAITDETTNYLYCGFIVLAMTLLYNLAESAWRRRPIEFNYDEIGTKGKSLITLGLYILMFSPILVFIIAPEPKVYLSFSYFQTNSFSADSLAYIFHRTIARRLVLMSFGSTILQYYRKQTKGSVATYLAISLFTWIDGKRAYFAFALIGLLIIDWIKGEYVTNRKLLRKAVVFVALIVFYFVYQGDAAGKSSDLSAILDYELYFSRMSSVMTSLYDTTQGWSMLDFHGQSFLYNLLFFVPRSMWPDKPVMFCRYYTEYAIGVSGIAWNLLVNIWTEVIANFGFVGTILGIYFYSIIAKISEKSEDKYIYLVGMIFCVFYSVFGFELFTTILWMGWIGLNVLRIIRANLRKVR